MKDQLQKAANFDIPKEIEVVLKEAEPFGERFPSIFAPIYSNFTPVLLHLYSNVTLIDSIFTGICSRFTLLTSILLNFPFKLPR